MALSTGQNKSKSQEQSQPEVGAQRPDPEVASPDAQEAAERGSAQASVDIVAMVSRDKNGDPAQSANFIVLVDDDAPDHVKDAAWNKAGEALGAKNYEERKPRDLEAERKAEAERRDTENKELRRHNRHGFADD